jgi:acetyl esterase/lipase
VRIAWEGIVLAGWSLGANFAAIAALREDPVGGDCVIGAETDACVAGVVGLDGVYDFAALIRAAADAPFSWTAEDVNEISAHTYVRATRADDRPVFRLFSGREEQLHAQAERFRSDLERADYVVELVRHPELSHDEVITAPGTVDALVDLAFG